MNDIPDIPTDEDYDRQASDQGYYRELMNFLSESNSMRDTAKNAVKQSMYAASGAFAGSFIGGPVGGLLGGVAGSLIGFTQSDDYDGAIVALTKLESDRQAVSFYRVKSSQSDSLWIIFYFKKIANISF